MKHLTLGTAGHVDHGKTALIKALTGFDCDTHKAEKERGITINLGFTHLTLPSGNTIGIIDVPGHEDFIHTMVEGAMGIDLGLLVVAANEGIMPQTREHINIMELLDIKQILIVITKTDLVDNKKLIEIEAAILEYIKSTSLPPAKIIKASAVTKSGIKDIIAIIDQISNQLEERPATGPFRMFIDRIFSKPGFGTIVTGSALNGYLNKETPIYLLPGNNEKISIKSIQRFGEEVMSISAGDRTAINLSGIKANDLKRGMLISDRILKTTDMIDVSISLNQQLTTLRSHSDIMFQSGDYNLKVNINILTTDILHGGETAFSQLKLPIPTILRHGDRFIIRSSSGNKTIGGGYILDITPLHHKKRRTTVTDALRKLDNNGIPELISQKVKSHTNAVTLNQIATATNFSTDELKANLNNITSDIIYLDPETDTILLSTTTFNKLKQNIIDTITKFYTNNPYTTTPITKQEISIALQLGDIPEQSKKALIQQLLTQLEAENKIKQNGTLCTIPGYPKTCNTTNEKPQQLATFIKKCGEKMKVPTAPELKELEKKLNINEKQFKQIIAQLIKDKIIFSSEKAYLHIETVNKTRTALIESLLTSENGITVAEFRDLINGNRKICLALLTIFDNEGTTIRKDNYRFLSQKAKRLYK